MKGDVAEVDRLLREVLASSKYGRVDAHFIKSIARIELLKAENLREAVKATKRTLHQVSGAYFVGRQKYRSWLRELERTKQNGADEFQKSCFRIMNSHSSTRERLGILDKFYSGDSWESCQEYTRSGP